MATSGALTIGVNAVPPMPPRLDIEKQPPDMSAGPSLPSRAFFASSPVSRAISMTPLLSASRMTGTTRPFGVSAAKPIWKYFFRIRFSPLPSSEALKSGNCFSAATTALIRKASRVSLMPAFSFSLLRLTRRSSRSLMSASSNWVTCGIITQLRARLAPEIFLIFDSGLASISPNLAKSTCGQGSRSRPPPAPAARPAVPPASACLTNFCTSSRVMRPLRSLPLTLNRSTPSSRANRRTAGLACGTLPGMTVPTPKSIGGVCVAGLAVSRSGTRAAVSSSLSRFGWLVSMVAFGAGAGSVSAGAAAGCTGADFGAGSAAAAASMMATTVPSATSSPSLTFSSLTTPATEDGTSMVALSDSSVISPWSFLTVSPGCTSTSMTGMPL